MSSVPPLLKVPPVIHFALLTVQLGLSLESELVSFEINFRYSYDHSSLQALLLVGTRMRDQAWLSPPALNQHSVHLEMWHYVYKTCSAVAEKDCKEFGYLAYSHSSLLLEALLFMVLSRRPGERSVAAGNGSSAVGLAGCWQNRWPRSGAGLTAAPIQKVCYERQDQAGPHCSLAKEERYAV